METQSKKNYTYILECRDGSYYCGWTNDLKKRLASHNAGIGGKYTRSHRPVKLIYYEAYATKEEAMQREWEIKQLPRSEKEKLVKAASSQAYPRDGDTSPE